MAQPFAADQEAVRQFVIACVADGASQLARRIEEHFDVSRPTAYNYIRALVDEGVLIRTSRGRYELTEVKREFLYAVAGLEEHVVWVEDVAPHLDGFPPNVRDILHYACTEMVNNVVDHSGSARMAVIVEVTAAAATIRVVDRGIGIFHKIATELGLEDDRHAVLELSKGKVTTDPDNHTGEGIFFSSRACDEFAILSRGVAFNRIVDRDEDWILERGADDKGTSVHFKMRITSDTRLNDVFERYATDLDEFRFDKTVVPVRLMQYGDDQLVSRSQAKRLLSRFDRFRRVVLDFDGVLAIGQAFADEVFRVFTARHPDVELIAVRTNEQVALMIARAQGRR